MGLARKLEVRLERLVDGLSAALFRGGMHPVELAGRVVRHADLSVVEDFGGPSIPNRFVVRVNPRDLAEIDRGSLDRELTLTLTETAAERGWRTRGPIQVRTEPDDDVSAGSIKCDTETVAGPQTPWAQLIEMATGVAYDITDNRAVVGRSSQADIKLPEAEVSRFHAVIFRKSGGIWILDLGSANGTRCGGNPVNGEPMGARTGDVLEFGPATFALRLV